MGTISSARAVYGLTATGTPTKILASGNSILGVGQQPLNLAAANIAYSLQITATGAGDVATLDMETGAVAQTTGTPSVTRQAGSISDFAGLDYEGVELPMALNLFGLLLSTIGADNADGVTVASDEPGYPAVRLASPGGSVCLLAVNGPNVAPTLPMTFSFVTIGDTVTVTVIAES